MKTPRIHSTLTTFAVPLIAGLLFAAAAFAADEVCSSCGQDVRVNGEFTHRKDRSADAIEGAPATTRRRFREDINGTNFTVTIAHLPAGRYTISIGEVESVGKRGGRTGF